MATQNGANPVDMAAFNIKLDSSRSKVRILISAGSLDHKKSFLDPINSLLTQSKIEIFATPGTHKFFAENSIPATLVNKISDQTKPNILDIFRGNGFDFVINIPTGDIDYDAASDAKAIRSLSIENEIPIFTDKDLAIAALEKSAKRQEKAPDIVRSGTQPPPWDMKAFFLERVEAHGGFKNHHAHFDKAFLISPENLAIGQVDMQRKWDLYKHLKENYTEQDLVHRISHGVEIMIKQGVRYCRTMVDADSTVGTLPARAAKKVAEEYASDIVLEIGVQPLQGVLDPDSYAAYRDACEIADYCGGLPSRDRPQPEKHLDRILQLAKDLGKPLDVHIDQENNPDEVETELLAIKTIEHGMQGRVFGVHAISLAAKEKSEQDRIIHKVLEADLKIIVCPSAALSMKSLERPAPLHNSIAPVEKLLDAGVDCYLGVDNLNDLFLPINDGDLWVECRILMEACRFYDIERVAKLACARPIQAAA